VSGAGEREGVLVTGIGVCTPIGSSRKEFWANVIAGTSGVARIRAFDPAGHISQIAAEIAGFDPTAYMSRKQARRMARVSQLATAAAVETVRDAGLDLDREDRDRIACVIGSAAGDYSFLEHYMCSMECSKV